MNNQYAIPLSFYIAEVISIANRETYTLNKEREAEENTQLENTNSLIHRYEIDCKLISPDPYQPIISDIRPADINSRKIPLVGEQVLIFQGYRDDSNIDKLIPCWYYLTTLSVLSNTNINYLTGLSESNNDESLPGKTFKEKPVSILQSYEGDLIVEGRWGNSIRFGSSIDTRAAVVDTIPNYSGNSGDPIIILSNSKARSSRLVTEDVEKDSASVYLTSTQRINNLTTNNPVSADTISVSKFANSQFIGIADRVVLKSKSDSIILDGKRSIEINAPKIYLGSSTSKEPLLHSDAVVKLLQKLVTLVKIGFADSSGIVCTPLYDSLPDAETLFQQLTNDNIQVDTYKNNSLNT